DMVAHGARHAYPARLRHSFEAGRYIHTVAVDIAVLDNHVSEIDADAEHDFLLFGDAAIALSHAALDGDRTSHGFNDTRELEQTISGRLYDTAFVFGYFRVDEFAAMTS